MGLVDRELIARMFVLCATSTCQRHWKVSTKNLAVEGVMGNLPRAWFTMALRIADLWYIMLSDYFPCELSGRPSLWRYTTFSDCKIINRVSWHPGTGISCNKVQFQAWREAKTRCGCLEKRMLWKASCRYIRRNNIGYGSVWTCCTFAHLDTIIVCLTFTCKSSVWIAHGRTRG